MYDVVKLKEDLKEILSEERYSHSLRVAEISKELARIYQVDIEKAYLAGLVHDIAKEFSSEQNIYYLNKYKLPKKLLQEEYRNILHGIIGASYLKEKYNLDDEICNAVKIHTISSPNMTMLDKVLFVADKIEPNKKFNGIEQERELAYQNIDDCLILCLENTIVHLIKKGKKFDKTIIETLESLKKETLESLKKVRHL